jgi:hypothetical protein
MFTSRRLTKGLFVVLVAFTTSGLALAQATAPSAKKATTEPANKETASTSTAAARMSSALPFAVKGLVLPPGASLKTDADEYIKEAAGLRIEALYLGGTEVPIKSGTLSPNMLIPTRDYGDVQLKFSLGGGPRFCQIWVTPKQEESFKTLCNKGQCEYPPASSTVKLPSSGTGCALIR